MASAAYAYQKQNSRSDAQIKRSQFVLIDGGLKNDNDFGYLSFPVTKAVAPHVPTAEEVEACCPVPNNANLATFVIGAIIAVAICVVSVFASNVIQNRLANAVATIPATEYTVVAGDSLSSIAQTHPIQGHSTSEVVSWIVECNNLESGLIVPGQALTVPSVGA